MGWLTNLPASEWANVERAVLNSGQPVITGKPLNKGPRQHHDPAKIGLYSDAPDLTEFWKAWRVARGDQP